MIRYAHLREHFVMQELPYNLSLVKDMGFPFFLKFVDLSGISYIDWLTFSWLIAAVIMTWLFVLVTNVKDRRIWLLVYAFVLFMPVAFSFVGRRIYRQAFLSPLYFITLEMMTILFVFYWNNLKISFTKLALFNIFLGGVFTITFYVKEDGVWLLMCLLAALLCSLIKNFLHDKNLKKKFIHAIIIFIPLAIFASGTVLYKSINEKFFGVYLINNRTEGELGQFLKNVYKTKSDERTSKIWAPTDVIIKFFDTSETLRNNEKLRYRVLHTTWYQGDIIKNPIQGDFLSWVMMTELLESDTCHSAIEQELFLKLVNAEIDAAFEKGILQKDDKFQLVSSMGGYSFEEILELKTLIFQIYKTHLLMDAYEIHLERDKVMNPSGNDRTVDVAAKEKFHDEIKRISKFINVDLISEDTNYQSRQVIAAYIFKIYYVLNSALFVAAIISIFNLKNFSQEILQYMIVVGFLLLSLIYALAVAWFSNFIGISGVVYYSNGIVPMITIFEIFGAYRLFVCVKRSKFISKFNPN